MRSDIGRRSDLLRHLASAVMVLLVTRGTVASQGVVWPKVDGWPPSVPRIVLGDATVRIGTLDGADETLLAGVVGATRLPDGSISIGDAAAMRVLFFDRRGRHLKTVGRAGDGPGEFRWPLWMARCSNGTIGIHDAGHNSLTFLSASGALLGTYGIEASLNSDLVLWCSGGNRLFVLRHHWRALAPGEQTMLPLTLVNLVGDRERVLVRGTRHFYIAQYIKAFSDVPLGRALLAAAGRGRIFSCVNQEGECTVFDTTGALQGRFRLGLSKRRVSGTG